MKVKVVQIHLPLIGHGRKLQFLDIKSNPVQFLPPLLGGGLVQALLLTCSPLPQVLEQSDQSDQSVHPPCIGQETLPHTRCSIIAPSQLLPVIHILFII